MNDSRATHWGAALINGVCVILGAFAGAAFQRERGPADDVSVLRRQLDERDGQLRELNERLTAESQASEAVQQELQACKANQLVPDSKPCPSVEPPISPPDATSISPSSQSQTVGGLEVILEHCLATGARIECTFQVKNLRDDRHIMLWAERKSLMVDQDGNEVKAKASKIGSSRASIWWSENDLIKGVPVRAALFFDEVPASSSRMELLQVGFAEGYNRDPSYLPIQFKGVPIER